MKTVQDYLKLGLVFIGDDMIHSVTGEPSYGSASLARCVFKCGEYPSGIKLVGSMCGMGEWNPSSFAWRNNDGVKPEYKGVIEVVLACGKVEQCLALDAVWLRGWVVSVVKWRPVVLQPDDAKNKPYHSFVTSINIGGPKFTIKEEAPSRTMTVNIEGRDYLIPSRTLTVSPKEDKPMKPVYTEEMHAKNELPPVGSKVKVCIEEAGFELDGNDSKLEGKEVTVKAAFINKGEAKVVAIESDKGKCACYIIECIKPIIKTIKVNGFDVPAPMSEAPMFNSVYFTPQTGYEVFYCKNSWRGDKFDSRFLSRGLIHSTESAAIAHAKAMIGIDPNA